MLIGGGVSVYLVAVVSRIDGSSLLHIPLTQHLLFGLLMALGMVAVRDIAYTYRIWRLTDHKLSIFKCFEIIMLWEFGSSVTPASVGGITLAMFILNKEKISLGRSAAIIMLCSYLDNLAFVTVFSLLYLALGHSMFAITPNCPGLGGEKVFTAIRVLGTYVWIGFIVVAFFGGLLGFAIFVKPKWAKGFFDQMAEVKWLQRWREGIAAFGEEIWLTSQEYKVQGAAYLLSIFVATTISWCARYALANVLIWTFSSTDLNQVEIFARQCVMRVIIMVPATPGGSGVAELSFMALNCDYLPAGLVSAVAIVWRLFNFYLYIAVGAVVLPRWISRVNRSAASKTLV